MKKSTNRLRAGALKAVKPSSMTKEALVGECEALQAQINKLKRSETRLKNRCGRLVQGDHYRNLFGQSKAVMLLIDPYDGAIVDANEAACLFYGWDRKTLLKKNISDIDTLPEKDIKNAFPRSKAPAKNQSMYRHRRANGRISDVAVITTPVAVGGNALLHEIIFDITAGRRAERALEKAHSSLEAKVAERTLDLLDAKTALEAEIEERKIIEKALNKALEDKDLLIKEIHHRTKNNLTVIQSLLRLQSRRISDEGIKSLFDQSRERLQALSMVHERLYRSEDLRSVEFAEYVRSLAHALTGTSEHVLSHIRVRVDVPKTTLDVNAVIPCGLIINELVTNSLKHAFPDGRKGTITISFQKSEDGQCNLEVRDDGAGFPEDISIENPDTFGMEIVRSLTSQLRGTFKVSSGHEGTTAQVTFREGKRSGQQTTIS